MELPNINKKQIENFLEKGKRIDSRKPFEYRDIVIEKNISKNAEGSARVKIGKTDIIVGIKLDVQVPYPDHEDEGTMVTSMEYSPACGSRYEAGPPRMDAIETARVVDRGIRESGLIDWKKLCIKEGEKVWSVSIDIYAINDDGNVLDASAIASLIALKLAKMPKYDEEKGKVVFGELTDEPLPLTEKVPFSMTFYKIANEILADPTRDEEDAAEARLTLAISKPGKEHTINAMQKGGMALLSKEDLKKIVGQAEEVYDEVFPKIEKKIKELMKE